MTTHTFIDLRYGILHSTDYVTRTGHRIHLRFETIWYDQLIWC